MEHTERLYYYPEKEEKLNVATHAFGVFLVLIGMFLLYFKSLNYSFLEACSYGIYAFTQLLIFSISTYYHSQINPKKRYWANVLDHALIYVSIAGTYTPFCVIKLNENGGWHLLMMVWAMALIGFIMKFFFTGKYNHLSTAMYIIMGWLVIFYWPEMMHSIDIQGIYWLIAGGIAYTIGAGFYLAEKVEYNHAIFHLFVLLGSFCHFITIYGYT